MAEDPQTPPPQNPAAALEEAAPPPPPQTTDDAPPPTAEPPADEKPAVETEERELPAEPEEPAPEPVDPEKKALDELKQLVAAALANHEFTLPPPPPPEDKKVEAPETTSAEATVETVEKTVVEEESGKTVEETAVTSEASAAAEAVEGGSKTVESVEETVVVTTTSEASAAAESQEKTVVVESVEETVVVAEAIEKTVVEEEGAKTVEAIEETVVIAASAPEAAPSAPAEPEEVFIWGVPLVPDERSDAVLLKFLRARELRPKDALEMIKNAVLWRKQFGIEELLEEDLGLPELNKTVFMHGVDKEGHPVCYNVYGEFQNAELYEKAFGDAEKRQKFLKWRIQYLEKGIRECLDFSPGGICEMVQVTDLKNSPWRGKHRQVMNQALTLLQDNYPEFVAKKVFINAPWWNLAYYRMMSSVFTPRTKSKFVFAGPSKSAETLFKYIAPEQVPVAYGGLSKENDLDFTNADTVTEVTIKPASKHSVEIPATESCLLTWELRVLGWEVTHGAEFVPSAEEGYTVIVQKSRKLIATDEPIIKTSFKIGEPGKIVLNFENTTSKKKKLLYRFKVNNSAESC